MTRLQNLMQHTQTRKKVESDGDKTRSKLEETSKETQVLDGYSDKILIFCLFF